MKYLLFNPKANNGQNDINVIGGEKESAELIKINLVGLDVQDFLEKLTADDVVMLCGGDGTLNRFANDTYGFEFPCPVYLVKSGTGNDFLRDIDCYDEDKHAPDIRKYLKDLPTVTINGETKRYINGIGFGIDGMVCEVADDMKEKGAKKINYTTLAIKLLLFKYKCPNAKVTVDGVTKEYERVWIASAMKGKYYGGGMMVAPSQDRNSGKLSVMLFHGGNRLKILSIFPKIFTGKHMEHTDVCDIVEGYDVTVEFDLPTALQIDGDTRRGVLRYTASVDPSSRKACECEEVKEAETV